MKDWTGGDRDHLNHQYDLNTKMKMKIQKQE